MFDVFDDIKSKLSGSPISIDNNVFQLHYKATMFLLIACSLLITQKQYFGDPIDCITSKVDTGIMDTYCWIHSTFTVPTTPGVVGEHILYPGVAPITDHKGETHEKKHHKYYQWVVLMLFLQALMFYIPRYLWIASEGGKINMLAADLNTPIIDDDMKKERNEMLVNYFTANINSHNFYAYSFFGCEFLNFVNVIGQMYLTDSFLGGEFLEYGTDVLRMSEAPLGSRHDPMDLVFPKVAKCTFKSYGSSGSVETHDGLCVLPLNIINEKIYIVIWFWFIIVAVASGMGLIYRLATIFLSNFRMIVLRTRSQLASTSSIQDVVHKCEIGDWFLLYQLAKNMDPLIYKDFINDLAMKMRGNGPI